ncbi:adenosylcobinamide amidohydrolase [Streptomyces sp. HB2AG]|uniref:adenosylcobinamide amidohydrolase n=1 Tax=Streptomyces sp. HB2AG TaxID=2983400 RepID=UPI0022AA907F|nr:adenosylcobinamide amidohydrolase [Streptomyces sp. HB2AG]MCZ2524153.1 adenosylcobinamide amidohydrolase [Streptomyces sp. HB2AG]
MTVTTDPLLRVEHLTRTEDGGSWDALLWRAGPGWRMVSSAVLGGGLGERAWVLNAQVRPGYARTDPAEHLAGIARSAGAAGPGVGLMTAAHVGEYGEAEDEGVRAVATAGIGVTTWAAAPGPGAPGVPDPGTINIVVAVPAPLADAALVNAVATATEAKVQALLEAGHHCSGTPTDAVCVAARTPAPGEAPELFAGPRSVWGARLARAVHRAVHASLERRTGDLA